MGLGPNRVGPARPFHASWRIGPRFLGTVGTSWDLVGVETAVAAVSLLATSMLALWVDTARRYFSACYLNALGTGSPEPVPQR